MSERGINGCGGLVVAAMKHVRVDAQGGVGLGVAEPLRDGHDVHLAGSDKLTGVGVSQRVERHVRLADVVGEVRPRRRHCIG